MRAFASMRAVRLFLRARALINILMLSEQRALQKLQKASNEHFVNFPPAGISLLLKRFAPSNLADTFKTGQQVQSQAT